MLSFVFSLSVRMKVNGKIYAMSLRYAFQSQTKLYLVMDYFNGGELFHYLSMGRFSEVWVSAFVDVIESSKILCS